MNIKYLAICTTIITILVASSTLAEEEHNHSHAHEKENHLHDKHAHDEEEGHDHEGEHDHNDSHSTEAHGDDHENHDEHQHDEEEGHDHEDEHQHNDSHSTEEHDHDEDESHDSHGDEHGHDEHEEGRTNIDSDAAKAAGIKVSTVEPATIQEMLTLTGRIMLNRNTTAEVRARFQGIVQNVKVNWGDTVKKNQPLATIEANESLRVYTVNAPTDGVVLTRNTNIGNVAGEEPLFTIADLSEVWAELHVFPRDLEKIKKEQQVRIHTLENNREIEAPITLILPTADPLSQTIIAVVSIPNQDGKWRPGMTIEGDVHISEKRVALAVTEDAVQRIENKTVVFVKEDNAYEKRIVELGSGDGNYIEVLSGVKAGEQYVSHGSFIVKADIGKNEAGHDH